MELITLVDGSKMQMEAARIPSPPGFADWGLFVHNAVIQEDGVIDILDDVFTVMERTTGLAVVQMVHGTPEHAAQVAIDGLLKVGAKRANEVLNSKRRRA